MNIDFATLTEYQRYKMMASLIVPRPIALVTTLGEDGVVNAAPFSMFNMLGEEPPIVMLSINRLKDGHLKHTAANIQRSKEFVVHMCDEDLAEQMHRCGENFPVHVSELDAVGLTTASSSSVAPPRIAEAPVAFECTLWETLETTSRQIFIGQVRWMHARDELIDTENWRVRLQHYQPVGRFGASFYVKTNERYALEAQAAARSTAIDEI
ncbi:flavin reductase (DIM6/NTAB) family NADH-FMN oxidoreductase RutF [Rhodoferax ferrireducens]|uniref:Flavin reductase (DIM6/NTAB) family NADH-FMN oxidoreductase RutF n=1 Tax=Rhodoferax ferrireducens TaxID=192843 RepID=A0ABU2C4Q2_9BURK|nr:flavin reductase family protein [Rhodoferax ferrireducens]MDR7376312.1 flavin reductase (DIM6/NTAB) family NADH-FMN oxidoreductase RutF [Rhodoferax ferrireducens]